MSFFALHINSVRLCFPFAVAAYRTAGSELSLGWSWTRPVASSFPRSASRSESEGFICCTACMDVRQLCPLSMSETLEMLLTLKEPRCGLSCFFWPDSSSCPQIRLALKDWEHVQKFEKDARDAQHWDAAYILQQMLSHKAFHFTAMPTLVSCLFHYWHCGQVDCPGSGVKGEHDMVSLKTFNLAC